MIKKFQRLVAVMLCLVMLLQVLPVNVVAAELKDIFGGFVESIFNTDSENDAVPDDVPDSVENDAKDSDEVGGIDRAIHKLHELIEARNN